jgi:threonine synthase
MRAVIFVPATVGEGKLLLMLSAGAVVFKVEEGYERAFHLSRASAQAFGWMDRNTGTNPLTVEAKKTVAFEIWEGLDRRLPDVVVVPVGDGTSLSAVYKGFRELVLCGAAEQIPRLIGVQAEGCQPLRRAWRGEEGGPMGTTIADGIAVDAPINALTAVRDVVASGGGFVAVSDQAILGAMDTMARGGLLAEPAAAAGYAGLQPALEEGLITSEETVVVLVTGTALKTPQYLHPSGAVFGIRGDIADVQDAMARDGVAAFSREGRG